MDINLAHEVCQADDAVDDIDRCMFDTVICNIKSDTAILNTYISHLGICRSLERIADLATNIAEDIIYLTNGEIVRHKMGD